MKPPAPRSANAAVGRRYSLEARGDLDSGTWMPTGDRMQSTNNVRTYFETARTQPHLFYRVAVQ